MSDWEARSDRHAVRLLVGDHFGDRPEVNLYMIRSAKKERAARLCRLMGCDKESVVLEIGSGMGFTSKYVAEEVKHLYCSDISASFLDFAEKECAGVPNTEFVRIEKEPATLLELSGSRSHYCLRLRIQIGVKGPPVETDARSRGRFAL